LSNNEVKVAWNWATHEM